ncbi:MAG: hypothetical protein COA37_17795 [Hoeflea sp.]|uniref:phage portal protein family protein n=1 Tax=Hoeflea sp. TaxID=1940281 RepID=UPI000C0DCBA6|nr:DUF935 family protein [Hoeflea sp.]PHR19284.1 MAG: hypothetical protein COA37_17795 [Hoeflea sp.]
MSKTPVTKDAGRKNLPSQARAIIAHARNDITIPFFTDVLQPVDETLIRKGGGKGLAIYDEIERDTHAWAVLQKRKKTLVARAWEVEPGGDDQIDRDAAEFITELLKELPYDRICEDALDATLKGFSVGEIVWGRDGRFIVPDRIIAHDQRRFVFDPDWKPRLLTLTNMMKGETLPDRKFIIHRHGVKGNNPYGLGLGTRLFWPVLFKREGVAFWMTFLEKYASPTVIGKTPYGMLDDAQNRLLDTLKNLVQETAATVPIGTEVAFLEATRSGAVSYKEWCEYWDNQMSIATLGETLSTDIQGQGSRAAADTHAEIKELLVDADCDLLSDTHQATLVRWTVDLNFPGAKLPKIWRIRPANEKADAETEEAKAKAGTSREALISKVTVSAARIEDDAQARDFIASLLDNIVDEDLIDTLVANRQAFAEASAMRTGEKPGSLPADPKKKDDPRPAIGLEAEFAERLDRDSEAQEAITQRLANELAPLETSRLASIRNVLDEAADLEDAAKRLLILGASWKVDAAAAAIAQALTAARLAGRDAVLDEVSGEIAFADPDVFNQPFKEQIDYFEQKEPRPSKDWTNLKGPDHDRGFMIAGAKDRDMLNDFHTAIGKALKDGTGLQAFRKDFDAIAAKYGWSYKGERDWRSKVIFETNVRTSYMAGRLKQMRDPAVMKARPFWMYRHGMTRKPKVPRRQHQLWDRMVLPADDPWFETHYPPNDWGCSCGVVTLSARDLKRLNLTVSPSPEVLTEPAIDPAAGKLTEKPQGIGHGWDHMPGDLWQRGLTPSQVETLPGFDMVSIDAAEPLSDLMASMPAIKAKEIASGKSPETYLNAFLKGFGAESDQAVLFRDKVGQALVISDDLFRNGLNELKVMKRGREIHAAQLAEAIRDPDEIWIGVVERPVPDDQGGGVERLVDRRYVRVDQKTGLLAIFELVGNQWIGRTAFAPKKGLVKTDVNQINKRRTGYRVFKRKTK